MSRDQDLGAKYAHYNWGAAACARARSVSRTRESVGVYVCTNITTVYINTHTYLYSHVDVCFVSVYKN